MLSLKRQCTEVLGHFLSLSRDTDWRFFDHRVFGIQHISIGTLAYGFFANEFQRRTGDEHNHAGEQSENADTEQNKNTDDSEQHLQ